MSEAVSESDETLEPPVSDLDKILARLDAIDQRLDYIAQVVENIPVVDPYY